MRKVRALATVPALDPSAVLRLRRQVESSRSPQLVFGQLSAEQQKAVYRSLAERLRGSRIAMGYTTLGVVVMISLQVMTNGALPVWLISAVVGLAALGAASSALHWRADHKLLDRLTITSDT